MNSNPLPEARKNGMTQIAPLLSVRRGVSAIDFYKRAFGADELFRIEDDKGEVVARLSIGGAEFCLPSTSPNPSNFLPRSLRGDPDRAGLLEEEPGSVFERA